ncbi:MAG: ribonuclease P protein component [Arenimonas sp.]
MKSTAHQRFPRSARIRTSAEYQAVFSEGSRVSGAYFRLHLAQGEAFPKPRLGIAVSKRVDKSAVARNRIKRVCRDYFRLHQHDYHAAEYVLIAKPDAAKTLAITWRADLEKLFHRAQSLLSNAAIGTMHGSPDKGAATSRDP